MKHGKHDRSGYIKAYCRRYGYCEQDIVVSELSGRPAADIHHIRGKGSGGSKLEDENGELVSDDVDYLIALTREEHEQAHGRRLPAFSKEYLIEKHRLFTELHDFYN